MQTRKVKVTRILTMRASLVVEIPAAVTNDDFESALYDRCNTHEAVLYDMGIFDMTEEDEDIDVEDSDGEVSKGYSYQDDSWREAVKLDLLEEIQPDTPIPLDTNPES